MGILNRPRDSPSQFLLYLDNFIDSIECINVSIWDGKCGCAGDIPNLYLLQN